eukprot:TRINITY_DN8972_c0_g2_i2.p1 TRINITY_DN8972_c0_g2~~TRINITY_DN8972_c0_g2_i2.p1  ORF type:complete len:119 (+),score=36.14 TRINITY_DN8972_c0_g2_i2:132-488(+)
MMGTPILFSTQKANISERSSTPILKQVKKTKAIAPEYVHLPKHKISSLGLTGELDIKIPQYVPTAAPTSICSFDFSSYENDDLNFDLDIIETNDGTSLDSDLSFEMQMSLMDDIPIPF